MKRSLMIVCAVVLFSMTSTPAFYEASVSQLLSFTGNVHAKAAWIRITPKLGNCEDNCGTNRPSYTSAVAVLSTRESGARIIDSTSGAHWLAKITRDGSYVIWSGGPNGSYGTGSKSWIVKWDGTGKKTLLDGSVSGTPGTVLSVQWNAALGQEFVYAATTTNGPVYRIPLNGDAVDLTKKTVVYNKTPIQEFFAVSSDGKYTAVSCPWPSIGRFNIETQTTDIITDGSTWTCMANLAPDASGWLSYVDETHMKITTVSLDKQTRNTIDMSAGQPGNRGRYDCHQPQWSNHPSYLTVMYPLTCENCGEAVPVFGEFCVGKYNAAYSSIQWICVTDTANKQYREGYGDAWLENGEHFDATGSTVGDAGRSRPGSSAFTVKPEAGGYCLAVSATGTYRIALATPSGRVVRTAQGAGPAQFVLRGGNVPPGMLFAAMESEGGTEVRKFMVR